MRNYKHKKVIAHARQQAREIAQALSLSLYPEHVSLLAQRERELNVPKSVLLQLLLDIEATRGLLRPEIEARIKASRRTPKPRRRSRR